MGILDYGIPGKRRDKKAQEEAQEDNLNAAESIFNEYKAQTAADQADLAALESQQRKDALEFEGRKQGQQGATRTGLMYGGNAQGVV